ncbi:MAG: helix-turn-helix domain-containing protein [Oscillospiraceae bacterium]
MVNNKIPYQTIVDAKKGSAEAMDMILKHYQPFIISMSRRSIINEYGNTYTIVDEDIRQ